MILGGSFLPILFGSSVPFLALLLSLAATLSLVHGFRRVWPIVLVAGLFADIATLSPLGLSAAFSVGIAYAAGFASHRIVTEHGFLLCAFGGLAVTATLLLYQVFSLSMLGGGFDRVLGMLLSALLAGCAAFPLSFFIFGRFERWSSSYESPRL